MIAAAILARAEAAGMTVQADGERLMLTAAAPPPTALLHDLAGAKAEILALLECRADEAAERAAIQAEAPLPPLGTPERERIEQTHRATVAGLLAASLYPLPPDLKGKSWQTRPPTRLRIPICPKGKSWRP
jgi:hypothetical protein